jgi:hypothetical protein
MPTFSGMALPTWEMSEGLEQADQRWQHAEAQVARFID